MGGCFSLPEPALEDPPNGQPPQADVAPAANALYQSIRDFFKKCLFSRWCYGRSLELVELRLQNERMRERLHMANLKRFEYGRTRVVRQTGTHDSAVDRKNEEPSSSKNVKTTQDIHPTVSNAPQAKEDQIQHNQEIHQNVSDVPQGEQDLIQYPRYGRSRSIGDIEKKQKELREEPQNALRRCQLDVAVLRLWNERFNKRLHEVNSILDKNVPKIISNTVDETETSSEEEFTDFHVVITTRDDMEGASTSNQSELSGPSAVRATETDDSAVDMKSEVPSASNQSELLGPSAVRATETDDSAVERKSEDPSSST